MISGDWTKCQSLTATPCLSGWRGGPLNLHPWSNEKLLASSSLPWSQNCLQHHLRPVAVAGSSLWISRNPSKVPIADGHHSPVPTPSGQYCQNTGLMTNLCKGTGGCWNAKIIKMYLPSHYKEVHGFLGLAKYYRHFSLASSSNLTKKGQPDKVCWTVERKHSRPLPFRPLCK